MEKSIEDNKYGWYILNVMAGQENKIATEIKSMVSQGALAENVVDAMVPSKQVMKIKRGKKIQDSQKLFPGYVFVNANISSDAYSALNSIPKVLGFLGSKNKPEEVSEVKMQEILNSQDQQPDSSSLVFEVGEMLNVIEGPFESFSGVVEEFDTHKKKVKISILIFGRATSVELELNQVEKA
jgi:transcription termination/antitermination protein NusG